MNASLPDPDQRPNHDVHPIERRLQRLQPQPLGLDAESIVAAAANGAAEETTADQDAPRPLAPATASHRWSLAAVGISGFAAGILLTYVVMSRATETTAPSVVVSTQLPEHRTVSAPGPATTFPPDSLTHSDTPEVAITNVAAQPPAPRHKDPWQSWLGVNGTQLNTETILAVRGSRPRQDLAGRSNRRSRFERQSPTILQPTLHRARGIRAGAAPGELLDVLLGPL